MKDFMINKKLFRMIILFTLGYALSFCSYPDESLIPPGANDAFSGENSSLTDNKPSNVSIENLEAGRSRTISDVEIVWQIPDESVEGYLINYGFETNNLEKIIKIKTSSLERFQDNKYGAVYRYVIPSIPLNKTVYITISAFNGDNISEPSKVFKVSAE